MTPPIPTYVTQRKFGVELEVDPAGSSKTLPHGITGWDSKSDASLSDAGREFIFSNPASWDISVVRVKALTDALSAAQINVSRKGSLHVHIHAGDFGPELAASLVNTYRHFQEGINTLVGMSRHHNHFCAAYPEAVTAAILTEHYQLDVEKTRERARDVRHRGGAWMNVNVAYLGVPAAQRSIEFRQCSSSTRAICVLGWMSFLAVIMDRVAAGGYNLDDYEPNFVGLVKFVKQHAPDAGVVEWLQWRRDFMSSVKPGSREKLLLGARTAPLGVYSAARLIDASYAAARAELDRLVDQGQLAKTGRSYRAAYSTWARADLADLRQLEAV